MGRAVGTVSTIQKYREQFELRTETDSFLQEKIRVWQIHELPDGVVPIMAKHMSAEKYLRNVRGKHNIPPLDFYPGISKKQQCPTAYIYNMRLVRFGVDDYYNISMYTRIFI